jgi:hypothetical protein
MHESPRSRHAAFFEFLDDTKDLETLSPEAQVAILKRKLFVALERAVDFQERSRSLELALDRLGTTQRAHAFEP